MSRGYAECLSTQLSSQDQSNFCQSSAPGAEESTQASDSSPANDLNVFAIIGSVLGSLVVLILSVILAIQLIRILRRKRRHFHTFQGTPNITVETFLPYTRKFSILCCYKQDQVKETQMQRLCTGKQVSVSSHMESTCMYNTICIQWRRTLSI